MRRALLVLVLVGLVGCGSGGVGGMGDSGGDAAGGVVLPPVAGQFEYQIGGASSPSAGTRIVDRDHGDAPAKGTYGICYVNAFQTQPELASWWDQHHPDLYLRNGRGRPLEDPDWPGERILDTSTSAKRRALLAVVGAWFDECARKGFDAVEPDNLDSWTRHGVGGRITHADDMAFARLLIGRAHHLGLAVAQKNTTQLSESGHRVLPFDFAIAEECEVFHECAAYTAAYGRHVIEIEYTDNGSAAFTRACHARSKQISIVLRDRDVTPPDDPAHVSRWC